MIFSSLRFGISAIWQNKKIVAIYYVANFFFGLILMLPMYTIFDRLLGHSLVGQKIPHEIDMDFVMELLSKSNMGLGSLNSLMLVVPALYWFFGLFLSGGAYFTLKSKEVYSASIFWAASVTYFWRFVRLFLWGIPLFGILYSLQFIVSGIQYLIFGKDPYQNIIFWDGWAKLALSYIGIIIYYLIFDYARIYTITNDVKKMHRALWQGIKFTFKNFVRTFTISFTLFIFGIVILFFYNFVADAIRTDTSFLLLTLIILQQFYIIFRISLRLILYASQTTLYNRLTSNPESTEVVATE